MSVALPSRLRDLSKSPVSRIWIRDTDSEGNPVNADLREAAYQKEDEFFRYRRSDIPDDVRVAELIEESVYKASKSSQDRRLKDPAAYLFSTYKSLLFWDLAKKVRIVSKKPRVLEHLAQSSDLQSQIVDHIDGRRVLDAMDADSRKIWERRLLGYQVREIAKEMDVSADCLSTRMRRAMRDAMTRLRGDVR